MSSLFEQGDQNSRVRRMRRVRDNPLTGMPYLPRFHCPVENFVKPLGRVDLG